MRHFIYSLLIFASIITFLWVRDVERKVHGSISPEFCTDCPQFYDWMNDERD
jgi:hypothetical protein